VSDLYALLQTANGDYQWLASLGVGGVLAGGMFVAYRNDRKASEDRLAEFTKDFRTIVQDNTKAMTSLIDVIREYKK